MKKFLRFILFLFFSCFVQAQDVLTLRTSQALDFFIAAEQQDELLTYETMFQIFTVTSLDYAKLREAIRSDFLACRRHIRHYPKNSVACKQLLQQLRSFYKYVKDHKDCYEAILFHNNLQERYQFAFNNPDIVQCLEIMPHLYGVSRCSYKCRTYFKIITADLREIEKHEDAIHGDFSVLKAHNYVYKMELVKIKNYVYHHNLYKYETRYF